MLIKQVSVFLENKQGRLYDVARLLGDNKIDIRALTVADTSDFGILRLIVDQPDTAISLLKQEGFSAGLTDVVAIEVQDRPRGLAEVMKIIQESKVNVEYMYAFPEKTGDKAILIFRFDNIDEAATSLAKKGLPILKAQQVLSL